MKKLTLKCMGLMLLAINLALPTASQAEEEASSELPRFNVGVLGGMGFYSSNLGLEPIFGGKVGYRIGATSEVGIVGLFSPMAAVSGAGTSTTVQIYNAAYSYHLDSLLKGLWFGAQIGYSNIYTSLTVSRSVNYGAFDYGPAAGYDYSFCPQLSVGIDTSFLMMSFSNFSGLVSTFNTLISVKYNFSL